jgi:predicted PurR-regulated permease PerM
LQARRPLIASPAVSRELLFAVFFFAVFVFLLHQLYVVLAIFAGPLVWAAILALTFYPFTTRLTRLFRGRRDVASAVLVVLVTAVAILPAVFIGSLLVREATDAYQRVDGMARSGELSQYVSGLRSSAPGRLLQRVTAPFQGRIDIDPGTLVVGATRWVSQQIAGNAAVVARDVLVTLVNFFLMLVALFFFFRDGERLARSVRDLLPMRPEHREDIFIRLYDTMTAVVQSMVLTAAVQGVLAGFGYWLIGGLSLSVLLGFLTALFSFVPMAGAAVVWGAAALYLFSTGTPGRAIGLALWGFLVVSAVDNFIKPLFIGGRARLPTLLLLFAMLGGLQVYGFVGIFLAPMIIALLLCFVEIYRELYLRDRLLVAPAE